MATAKFNIERKCEVCGEIFRAKMLKSRYCSVRCANVACKRRKLEAEKQKKLDKIVKSIPQARDFIKVSEAYALFGISRDTLYRQIRKGNIPTVNLGINQIRLSKEKLMEMYPLRTEQLKAKPAPKLYSLEPKDCYTIGEVCKKYHMDDSTLYLQIRKYSIPTRQIGNYVYVPKQEIDNLYK